MMLRSIASAVLLLAVADEAGAFSAPTLCARVPQHAHIASLGPAVLPSRTHVAPRARKAVASNVVVKEDYKLAIGFAAVGATVLAVPWLVGVPSLLLAVLFAVQTLRVRFVFDDEAVEVKAKEFDKLFESDAGLVGSGENFAVGGENRWRYDSIVNYEFIPSESLPILVYFKETQTPQDKWEVGPGKWANSAEALAKGAVKGQVHFFPCIVDKDMIKEQFETRGCGKL